MALVVDVVANIFDPTVTVAATAVLTAVLALYLLHNDELVSSGLTPNYFFT